MIIKKIHKITSTLPLIFSIFIFIYIFYRSELQPVKTLHHYYLKYYIINLILFIFSIIFIFIKKTDQINVILFSVSLLISFYFIEGFLTIKNLNKINKITLSTDEKIIEKYYDEKIKDVNTTLYLGHNARNKISFKKKDKLRQYFLSDISNNRVVLCNENGYYAIYKSDRYGFNNPDKVWEKKKIEFLVVGDSFAHGSCVNEKDTINGNLRNYINSQKGSLNLGHGGNGPLIEYATLKEYFPEAQVEKIIWLYYEANDLSNLKAELKNDILVKYLVDENFTQNLKNQQHIIDAILKKSFNLKMAEIIKNKKNQIKSKKKPNYLNFLKLYKIRKLTIEKFFVKTNPNFSKIITKVDKVAKKNGSNLFFVYVPECARFNQDLNLQDMSHNYKNILKIIKNLQIPVIDMVKEISSGVTNPLSLYSATCGHLNTKGYKFLSELIYKNTNSNHSAQ